MSTQSQLEESNARQKVALEKRLNEIRRLEGVKDDLLTALKMLRHLVLDLEDEIMSIKDIDKRRVYIVQDIGCADDAIAKAGEGS